ncbi:MAG: hypothetical protein ACO3P3_02510 [Candidatus Nanopelagicales bacterium]
MKFAAVLADVAFLHTDHPYDYIIPEQFQSDLEVGMRVSIKFGGRKTIGFVVGLKNETEHKAAGEILEILDVFPVLKPDIADFCQELGRRYLTAQSQVLSFALPTATQRVNQKLQSEIPEALRELENDSVPESEIASTSFLMPTSVPLIEWSALKVVNLLKLKKRGIVLLPNYALMREFESNLRVKDSSIQIGVLAADMTPSQRYEQFMKIWRGEVHLVIGTRSAVFAPLTPTNFIFMLHENDDSFVEQQSGNWHCRDVAIIRCAQLGVPFYCVGYCRSVEIEMLIQQGKMSSHLASGPRGMKTIQVPKDDASSTHKLRLPSVAFNVIRQGLAAGPVLLQVPIRGYQLNIQCARCREKAACDECGGALERSANEMIHCTRCGRNFGQFRCQWCSSTQVRSITVGAVRTAEEIAKAFPNTPIFTSGKNNVLHEVENSPALVISTPGAEPRVQSGAYQAIVILDPEITLNRIDLRAHEEAFRRWYNIKSLGDKNGVQLIATEEPYPLVRYIINDDPVGFAELQLRERKAAELPPMSECYLLEGDYGNVSEAIASLSALDGIQVLGPAQHKRGTYALVKTSENLDGLNSALRAILAKRSSSKAKGVLRIRYSPQVIP